MPDHVLVLRIDTDGDLGVGVECTAADNDGRWCRVWHEIAWHDDLTCRCTESGEDCPSCREGDHGDCSTYGAYIDNVGHECRCSPEPGSCWIAEWVAEVGWEVLELDKPVNLRLPVKFLSGNASDDPIRLRVESLRRDARDAATSEALHATLGWNAALDTVLPPDPQEAPRA